MRTKRKVAGKNTRKASQKTQHKAGHRGAAAAHPTASSHLVPKDIATSPALVRPRVEAKSSFLRRRFATLFGPVKKIISGAEPPPHVWSESVKKTLADARTLAAKSRRLLKAYAKASTRAYAKATAKVRKENVSKTNKDKRGRAIKSRSKGRGKTKKAA